MKKKLLLPLFLVPFLVGCGARTHTIEELKEIIGNYEPINRNMFTCETKGRVFGHSMDNGDVTPMVYELDEDDFRYQTSVLYGINIKLNIEDFYVFTSYLKPSCQYYNIKGQLVDMAGSPTILQSEVLKDGSLKFFVSNSNNKLLEFGHYFPQEGYDPSDPYSRDPITEFSGKIDGCYIFDKYGYLIYEEFKTHTQNGPDSLTAFASCTYNYFYEEK